MQGTYMNAIKEAGTKLLASFPKRKTRTVVSYDAQGCPIWDEKEYPIEFDAVGSSLDDTYVRMIVKVGPRELLSFNVRRYPACCAMYQLNDFRYFGIDEKEVAQFADICIKAFHEGMGQFTKNGITLFQRVIINFVEEGRTKMLPEEDVNSRPTKEDQICFPLFYKWAKGQKAYRELKFYNQNSHNIIHMAEVVLNISK